MTADSDRGFTLIELVVAISISGVLVGFMAMFITTPMQAYFAQSRRTMLVNSADTALRMIAADVHTALPNSVRPINNGGIVGIELLATTDMVDYRDTLGTPDALGVDFGTADNKFSTMGTFRSLVIPVGNYLSIGNAGVAGQDAYEVASGMPAHVITPAGTTIAATANAINVGQDDVSLSSAVTFTFPSTPHHVFLVSGPIAYLCDSGAQTLTRFSGYSISTTTGGYSAGLLLANGATTPAIVARNVASCQFDIVAPGPAPYGQLDILRLLLSIDGDNLPLMQETPVDNIP
jgi:MSHA biogenesis protein MshO